MSQSSDKNLDEKWSGFLSRAIHELRTPLSSILMLAEMSGERRIHQATEDVLALLAEISEYGKIEGGRIQLVQAEVFPTDLARKIEQNFRPLAEEMEVEFAVELQDGLPGSLRADRQVIERISSGLLNHVLRSPGVKQVTVELQHGTDESFVLVVRDDGPEIPTEQQETFFEPFLHARAGTRRRHGGQGLGLAIAETLARCLGGELTLVCVEGHGNVLTLNLPLGFRRQ